MEFFLAPRQGDTLFTIYRIHTRVYVCVEREEERYNMQYINVIAKVYAISGLRWWPNRSQVSTECEVNLSFVCPTTTGVPFKALCAVSTGQILDRRIKRGCLSIYLLFPGRWIVTVVRCNYLKPVSNTRFLTRLVEIFR